jgi:hypothetical protein
MPLPHVGHEGRKSGLLSPAKPPEDSTKILCSGYKREAQNFGQHQPDCKGVICLVAKRKSDCCNLTSGQSGPRRGLKKSSRSCLLSLKKTVLMVMGKIF